MLTVFLRTFLVFIFLVLMFRLMGKRQIGEMEIPELVSALLFAQVAAIPIQDAELPLSYSLFPLGVLVSGEVILSYVKNKSPLLKRLLEGRPNFLVKDGHLSQKELRNMRLSLEELLGELRLLGVGDLSEVNYAILEPNGKISVFLKKDGVLPSRSLIVDGKVNRKNLEAMGKSLSWLQKEVENAGTEIPDIFLFTLDSSGNTRWIPKEER